MPAVLDRTKARLERRVVANSAACQSSDRAPFDKTPLNSSLAVNMFFIWPVFHFGSSSSLRCVLFAKVGRMTGIQSKGGGQSTETCWWRDSWQSRWLYPTLIQLTFEMRE